ncbi:LysM peptidoglycan-binding domain-containing protein, partial [Aeromonas sp.]
PTKGAMLTGKGQASKPAAVSRPVAVSKPAQVQSQPVMTNRMPATEPNRSRDGGAPVSSVSSSSGAGVIKPYVVAAKEPNMPVSSVQSNDKAKMIRHVVTRGQSLSRLAEKFGVSQARLVEINKLKSRDIQIGQVLYIPQK